MQTLTDEIDIKHPEAWTLLLAINQHELQYILFSDAQANSLITNRVALNAAQAWTQAVESAVYDHSVLLDDYGKVAIVVNAPHFVILPTDIASNYDLAHDNYTTVFPDDDCETTTCLLSQCNIGIAFGMPGDLQGFLMRTFNNAPIYHHLFPLCEHFKRLNTGTGISRMFINMHDTYMDMVIYSHGEVILANTFYVRNTADATFLALHTWKSFQLNATSDEIQLTGERQQRDQLAAELRKYVKFVMPAIYPAAALRLSDDVASAPLDLILLATCE